MNRMHCSVAFVLTALVWLHPAAADDAASPDAVLDTLVDTDPAALAQALEAMRERAAALDAQAKDLRERADEADRRANGLQHLLGPLNAFVDAAAAPQVTFANDVFPIFEQRCLRCHSQDKRKGGLSLATFSHAMEGGSSGPVIDAGSPDMSRMLRLVMQTEEPVMPPRGKPLEPGQIETIREWIALGAPRDSSSKVVVAKVTHEIPEDIYTAAAQLDGPPPMPEGTLAELAEAPERPVVARAIAASPTAPLLAVGGLEQVVLYDLKSNAVLGALPFEEGNIYALTFSLNGQLLLAAGGREGESAAAVLWDVPSGERLGVYGRGWDALLAADISPDHRMVALGGPDRTVRVYSTETAEVLYECGQHTDWIYSVRFSPDGELLATGDRAGNLLLWQAANGRAVEPLQGHDGAVHDLAYTPDSNLLLSAGGDGKLFVWDTWKYAQVRNFAPHKGAVFSVDINSAGHVVTAGEDGLTKRWDLNGKLQHEYESLGDWAYQTVFAKSGELVVSGSWAGQIGLWTTNEPARVASLTTTPQPGETSFTIAQEARPDSETSD